MHRAATLDRDDAHDAAASREVSGAPVSGVYCHAEWLLAHSGSFLDDDNFDEYGIGLICDPADPQDIAAKIGESLARYRANVKRARQEINRVQEEKKLVTVYNEVFEAAYGENSV